jgi:hypothetical protein
MKSVQFGSAKISKTLMPINFNPIKYGCIFYQRIIENSGANATAQNYTLHADVLHPNVGIEFIAPSLTMINFQFGILANKLLAPVYMTTNIE